MHTKTSLSLCDFQLMYGNSGPVETGTQSASTSGKQGTTHPHWREAFHLCVGSTEQVLEVVVVHASGGNGAP